jgi:hypothetical protein
LVVPPACCLEDGLAKANENKLRQWRARRRHIEGMRHCLRGEKWEDPDSFGLLPVSLSVGDTIEHGVGCCTTGLDLAGEGDAVTTSLVLLQSHHRHSKGHTICMNDDTRELIYL